MKTSNKIMSAIFSIGVGFLFSFLIGIAVFALTLILGRFTIWGEGMGFLLIIVVGFAIGSIAGIIGFMFGLKAGSDFWKKHLTLSDTNSKTTKSITTSNVFKFLFFIPFAVIAFMGTKGLIETAFRMHIFNQTDPRACYQLEGADDIKNCYTKKLTKADKYEYCFPDRININEIEQGYCLLMVAKNTKNPKICEEVKYGYSNLPPVDNQNNCYKSLIETTKDKSLCEKLTPTSEDPDIVSECLNK